MNAVEKAGVLLFVLGLTATVAMIVTKESSVILTVVFFLLMAGGGLAFVLENRTK
jgi:hypothetical protein